jgi:hypothetical protein
MGLRVGDFAKFKHQILVKHSHVSASDAGLVVGLSPDERQADVVWPDGDSGTYRVRDLSRTEGVIGKVVAAPKRPIRDRGVVPMSVPPRPVVASLPIAPQGQNYEVRAFAVEFFIPSGTQRTLKNGEKREDMMRIVHHKVHVRCNRTGRAWVYTGAKRGGVYQYSDSRTKDGTVETGRPARSLKSGDFFAELGRIVGDKVNDALMGLTGDTMPIGDYKALIGA